MKSSNGNVRESDNERHDMIISNLKAWSFSHQNEKLWSNVCSLINLKLEYIYSWVSMKGNWKCNVGAVIMFVSCEIWTSYRNIPEDASLVWWDAVFTLWHRMAVTPSTHMLIQLCRSRWLALKISSEMLKIRSCVECPSGTTYNTICFRI